MSEDEKNKYEEMARKALAEQQERKKKAEVDASARREEAEAERSATDKYIGENVRPLLQKAVRGLKAAGIEAEIGNADPMQNIDFALRVGHNRAGQTLHRQTTLTGRLHGKFLDVSVQPARGAPMKWRADKESPADALDPAIQECIDIWTERKHTLSR